MSERMITTTPEWLKEKAVLRLSEAGLPRDQAAVVAEVLVFADLRGVHSHGVMRIPHYAERIRRGGINTSSTFPISPRGRVAFLLDAEGGMGHVAANKATEAALELVSKEGLALAGIRRSSHAGAMSYYVQKALDAGVAALVVANTDPAVVPPGGKVPFLGTNPLAFGFPGMGDDVLLDMATSEVALGKVLYAREKNTPIPPTWAVDEEGNPTTDPHRAKWLLPFGGYKGYGIILMIELLTGVLIGGAFGPHLVKMYGDLEKQRNLAMWMLFIDPGLFRAADEVKALCQKLVDEIHAQPSVSGEQVMVPGEPEQRTMEQYLKEGIPLAEPVWRYLEEGR
ncbi:Malate/L-lactate dehydrogenase [Spirochaeta thermophila DSM 6578]|uniref:Malate/L-lactate dehydrogenase n=1 Tax=Winmispira thermophila (strain ATCC 700085 / DSM 6578 / Z-1203) TaxID=869211 RepID=G0GCS0_WINT7|nr:Ldh family oxidoreductase [Spirochaeta thermophila]AEJ60489.1 Malate/L-lactate dehydrogenase [Spirochaeta thermophila DSM 6578]